MILQQKKIINGNKFFFINIIFFLIFFVSWDIDINDDDALSIKYPSISTIDWDVLTRVDKQMEEALQQCQQDFIQYEQFFQNLIKEVCFFYKIFVLI